MIINGSRVTGIFVWDNTVSSVTWTMNDVLFINGSFYLCLEDTTSNPNQDPSKWKDYQPTVSTLAEFSTLGATSSKYVSANVIFEYLYNSNSGRLKFLGPDNQIRTFKGSPLSSIDITSIYFVDPRDTSISDFPSAALSSKNGGVIKTYINEAGTKYQELLLFGNDGEIATHSVRQDTANWITTYYNNPKNTIVNDYHLMNFKFRRLLRYVQQNGNKTSVLLNTPVYSMNIGTYGNLKDNALKVQLQYKIQQSVGLKTISTWVDIFGVDIMDSFTIPLVIFEGKDELNQPIELKLENGLLTLLVNNNVVTAGSFRINKILGNNGAKSQNSDGTNYSTFQFE